MATRKQMMIPVSKNDLPAVQGWLQGLATHGWLLEGCRNGTFFFIQKAPTQRRYRIDPSKGTTIGVATPKLMDMYLEFGWHYVDSYDRYHHVFYTDDPEAVEPFVSPEALAESLERLKRKRLFFSITSLILWVIFRLFFWKVGEPDLFRKGIDVLLLLSLSYAAYHDIKPLLKVKEQASDGSLLNSRSPHQMDPTTFRNRKFASVVLILLFAYLIVSKFLAA